MCGAYAKLYACFLEYFIYHWPETGISVLIHVPAHVFGALSDIFVIRTGLEVAFLNVPENLRAFVCSIFWITIAMEAAIGTTLAPVSQDLYMA